MNQTLHFFIFLYGAKGLDKKDVKAIAWVTKYSKKGSAQMFEIVAILKKHRNLIELQEQDKVGKPISKDCHSTPGACVCDVLSVFTLERGCSGRYSGSIHAGL